MGYARYDLAMATITPTRSDRLEEQSAPADGQLSLASRVRTWRPRPLHASAIVTGIVALTSFEMSFAALHDLSVRNLVAPALAANVPIAIDGLVVGSIIATATFRRGSSSWWYATALFVFWTLVSVAGNIEYAREIGGSPVALSLYAGMPLTMLFAVHLTLMLFGRRRERARIADSAPVPQEHSVPVVEEDSAPAAEEDRAQLVAPVVAPVVEEDSVPAAEKNWVSAVEQDWDSELHNDWDSAPSRERVVPMRIPAILENTDPLPVTPKKVLASALPGNGYSTSPRITPMFATTGPNGQTKINPL